MLIVLKIKYNIQIIKHIISTYKNIDPYKCYIVLKYKTLSQSL